MINIKKASLADLKHVVPLFDAYRIFYGKESNLLAAESFLSERLTNNESIIYIARNAEDKAVGFIQLYPLFSSTRMQRLWLLNDLYVDASARRQGIARKLIDQAKQLSQATKSRGFFLETGVDNHEGNSLYPAAGMTLNKESNYYFWNVVD